MTPRKTARSTNGDESIVYKFGKAELTTARAERALPTPYLQNTQTPDPRTSQVDNCKTKKGKTLEEN